MGCLITLSKNLYKYFNKKEIDLKNYIGFIYETTNNITGKKYIGSHIGQEFDIYFGSGVLLQQDLKKYGTNNFTRLILEKVETINQLSAAETKWLTDVDAKSNPLYYNRTNCAGVTYKKSTPQPDRGVCPVCNEKPVAINYTSNGKTRYRKLCDSCIKKGKKIKPSIPEWFRAGYRKKQKCDKCGFLSKLVDRQISVHYLDGDLKNNSRHNLVSICLNCKVEIADSNIRWKPAPLTPDF
jgi:hypothetical protein